MINKIWETKDLVEDYYELFHNSHQNLLNLLEDSKYIITEKNQTKIKSILNKYNKDLKKLDDIFMLFKNHDNNIKKIMRDDVGMLKKKREETLTLIASQMERKKPWDDDLPF